VYSAARKIKCWKLGSFFRLTNGMREDLQRSPASGKENSWLLILDLSSHVININEKRKKKKNEL
jgi:hypothetical protein